MDTCASKFKRQTGRVHVVLCLIGDVGVVAVAAAPAVVDAAAVRCVVDALSREARLGLAPRQTIVTGAGFVLLPALANWGALVPSQAYNPVKLELEHGAPPSALPCRGCGCPLKAVECVPGDDPLPVPAARSLPG